MVENMYAAGLKKSFDHVVMNPTSKMLVEEGV